jgi:hypothetical protein
MEMWSAESIAKYNVTLHLLFTETARMLQILYEKRALLVFYGIVAPVIYVDPCRCAFGEGIVRNLFAKSFVRVKTTCGKRHV